MPDDNDRRDFTLAVPADDRAVAEAVAAARRFGAEACPGETAARLAIIVEELVTNIIEHGAPPAGDRIELSFARTPGGIAIGIIDGGQFFDPRSAAAPGEPPPERGGGAGIALVLAWAEVRDYHRATGRNRLDLTLPLA